MTALLAIDVGNTNTVFALYQDGALTRQWRCATNAGRTADEYYAWLTALAGSALDPGTVRETVIASVVPGALLNLEALCQSHLDTRPLVVGHPDCLLPVAVRVDPATRVGSDRLVNTVAAHARYGGDLIVVDFGTATTFDVVDTDGAYIGGVIAPGIDLSLQALHRATAALPEITVVKPDRVVGKNTLDCMHSGIYWGYLSLIEGICTRIRQERGRPMTVIGTGGLARIYARSPSPIERVDTELTVTGLKLIFDYNRSSRD